MDKQISEALERINERIFIITEYENEIYAEVDTLMPFADGQPHILSETEYIALERVCTRMMKKTTRLTNMLYTHNDDNTVEIQFVEV